MADETPAAPVAEDQTATDPRLEQAQAAPVEAEEAPPEPVEAAKAPLVEEAALEVPETPVEGEKKAKKSVEEALKGRVGHLTKTLSTKDAELADTQRRLQAAEALLASSGNQQPPVDGAVAETPPAAPQNGQRTYTQAEFDEQVRQRAVADTFNRSADAMYDAGKAKFDDWKDSVDTLNAVGIMSPVFLEAAMATDDGAAVVHHLGTDIDEASRIAALPPVKMAAELAKLAIKLSGPTKVAVSGAPAPIRPVTGAVNPQVDVVKLANSDDMSAYVAERAKQGSPWAQARSRR